LRPLAAAATRTAGASRPTTATAGPTAARPARTAALSTRAATAAAHPLNVLRELRQLAAVELAIAVGVEAHRVLDEPLRRGRTARTSLPTRAAAARATWTAARTT
jgi:hypothetical protein